MFIFNFPNYRFRHDLKFLKFINILLPCSTFLLLTFYLMWLFYNQLVLSSTCMFHSTQIRLGNNSLLHLFTKKHIYMILHLLTKKKKKKILFEQFTEILNKLSKFFFFTESLLSFFSKFLSSFSLFQVGLLPSKIFYFYLLQ